MVALNVLTQHRNYRRASKELLGMRNRETYLLEVFNVDELSARRYAQLAAREPDIREIAASFSISSFVLDNAQLSILGMLYAGIINLSQAREALTIFGSPMTPIV